jgi:signal transduction histidine kinase
MDGRRDLALRMNEQLDQIRRHADRELARSRTSGAPAAAGASTDVGQTVERLLRLMRRMPRGDGLDWTVAVPDGLGVRMEPDDFGEILGNLLDNARKWATRQVVVRAEPAGEVVRIVVEDDGPGFPAQILERGMSDGPDSSGLGLSIVQDALAEYGKTLGIEGGPDGCRVWFEALACPASAAIVPFPGKLGDAARSARGAAAS